MSMTKTGIIGLVVLIVILIGGYSIVTQTDAPGPLGQNGTTTDETVNGTTTDENTEDAEGSTTTDEEPTDTQNSGDTETNGETDTDNTDTTEDGTNETEGTTGIGGMGDWMSDVDTNDQAYNIPMETYTNEDLGVSFEYPETWDIEENEDLDNAEGNVVVGADFAGGMKAEMTVTVYDDATVKLASMDDDDEIVLGKKYEVELECKGDDLDCAGGAFIIPVEGEMTEDGFEGKVIEVEFGVFEMGDYDGPDVGVDVTELLDVTASTFAGAVSSINIAGVSGVAGFASMTGTAGT